MSGNLCVIILLCKCSLVSICTHNVVFCLIISQFLASTRVKRLLLFVLTSLLLKVTGKLYPVIPPIGNQFIQPVFVCLFVCQLILIRFLPSYTYLHIYN